MDPEMAKLGLYISLALKALLAALALLGVVHAARRYNYLRGWQIAYFWVAAPMTALAIAWAIVLGYVITHPWIAPMVPAAGVYFLIFASPAAALAAGSTMGIFAHVSNKAQ